MQLNLLPMSPVELRYENAYDIRVISGYDKNENGLDDEVVR
ncbi:MAG: hypothetical protein ACLUJG_07135 [Lawsonibacter sp.]